MYNIMIASAPMMMVTTTMLILMIMVKLINKLKYK